MKSTVVLEVLLATLVMADRADADGKSVFDQVCSKCHRTGVLDAPVAGNKAAWEPRVKAGRDRLYESAINGKNSMPPKGGKDRLSDDDAKAAVDYMVGLAGL
jgi:cytochrome c5